jgi:hypothetical protein
MCWERHGVQKLNSGKFWENSGKYSGSWGMPLEKKGVGRMALKIPQTRIKAVFTFV